MRKEITGSRSESRPEWEQLEDWVRGQVQRLIQELLEEEVTEFLGRAKSARRSESDSATGYRNGYASLRRLTLSSGTIQLRRPRVRDSEEQFESRLLPLFVHRSGKVAALIPELYPHGLSERDFDLALRGLLGEDAPVSASTVARLKGKWNDEIAQWRARPLDDLEVVYMWVDGVYVKAGLEREKTAVLVVSGGPGGSGRRSWWPASSPWSLRRRSSPATASWSSSTWSAWASAGCCSGGSCPGVRQEGSGAEGRGLRVSSTTHPNAKGRLHSGGGPSSFPASGRTDSRQPNTGTKEVHDDDGNIGDSRTDDGHGDGAAQA